MSIKKELLGKTVLIGRSPDNDIELTDGGVSSRHAKLTFVSPNTCLLEDTNSTNGTYVDGVRVHRLIIGKKDRVQIANVFFDTAKYFNSEKRPTTPPRPSPLRGGGAQRPSPHAKSTECYSDFEHLKLIWDDYNKLKSQTEKKGLFKSMGFSVGGMVLGSFLMPGVGEILGGMAGRALQGLMGKDEGIHVIEEEFRQKYVCPGCSRFLGKLSHDYLSSKKSCSKCKIKWVE